MPRKRKRNVHPTIIAKSDKPATHASEMAELGAAVMGAVAAADEFQKRSERTQSQRKSRRTRKDESLPVAA